MKIAFYGSSLLSSRWNGAATYYRGIIKALAGLGHDITFYEPDVFGRQQARDIEPPAWCEVVVYDGTPEAMGKATAMAGDADVVVKASGVGYEDDALFELVQAHASREALVVFWDVDAPATLASLAQTPEQPLRRHLASTDLVLTYGGGDPVVEGYRAVGVGRCVPIYNALDPDTHHPVAPREAFAADLSLLANRLPDREARIDEFFFRPAARLDDCRFLLGGSGWEDKAMPSSVRAIGHVGTGDHNAFNCSAKAVLNVSRDSMARNGFSPATRVFEAAGAGACLITDDWPGLDLFLKPGEEVLAARDGADVADILSDLSPGRAAEIGRRALARVKAEHTYDRRAVLLDRVLADAILRRRSGVAA